MRASVQRRCARCVIKWRRGTASVFLKSGVTRRLFKVRRRLLSVPLPWNQQPCSSAIMLFFCMLSCLSASLPLINTLSMHRTKLAIARNVVFAALFLSACFFFIDKRAAFSAFQGTTSRVCPDPSQPDYFQKLAKSTGVNASKRTCLSPRLSLLSHSVHMRSRHWGVFFLRCGCFRPPDGYQGDAPGSSCPAQLRTR